jgi:UrcA family protein
MITTNVRKTILSAILSAACTLPLVALAGHGNEDHSSARVTYRDLDVSSSQGIHILDRRLHKAAEQVCGSSNTRRVGWKAAIRNRQCARQAVARAWARFNSNHSGRVASLGQ